MSIEPLSVEMLSADNKATPDPASDDSCKPESTQIAPPEALTENCLPEIAALPSLRMFTSPLFVEEIDTSPPLPPVNEIHPPDSSEASPASILKLPPVDPLPANNSKSPATSSDEPLDNRTDPDVPAKTEPLATFTLPLVPEPLASQD
jgi:hypothetical protein